MNVLEIATSQFKQKLAGELQFISVYEWKDSKGEPVKIYYKPSMTFKQLQKVMRATNNGNQSEAIIQTLIIRALDEDGKPLFRQNDMTQLMNETDPEVINKIVIALNEKDESIEEIKKN